RGAKLDERAFQRQPRSGGGLSQQIAEIALLAALAVAGWRRANAVEQGTGNRRFAARLFCRIGFCAGRDLHGSPPLMDRRAWVVFLRFISYSCASYKGS